MEQRNDTAATKIGPEERIKLIRKGLRFLEEFKKIDAEMPLQQVITFMEAALADQRDGISISDLAVRVGNSTSSTSRNVAILGEFGRGNNPGHQVVKAVVNPMDRRYQLVKLTPKGERVVDQLIEVLSKEI